MSFGAATASQRSTVRVADRYRPKCTGNRIAAVPAHGPGPSVSRGARRLCLKPETTDLGIISGTNSPQHLGKNLVHQEPKQAAGLPLAPPATIQAI